MSQLLSNISGVISSVRCQGVHSRNKTRDQRKFYRLEGVGATLNDKCTFSQKVSGTYPHQGRCADGSMQSGSCLAPTICQNCDVLWEYWTLSRSLFLTLLIRPLWELLKNDTQCTWVEAQERVFLQLKQVLSSPPVLSHYSSDLPTRVSADTSSYGMGAVLLQLKDGDWRPIFYASRSMMSTAALCARRKGSAGIYPGLWKVLRLVLPSFTIETDHQPLLALLKTKGLDELLPQIQRFHMYLMRYSYKMI